MHNNLDLTNSTYINITVEKGKTLDKVFQAEIWTGSSYVGLFDFTPYTSASLVVKTKPNDFTNVLAFTTADFSIDFTGLGQFTLFKNANAMNIRSGSYVYEMVLKNASETRGFLRGKFVIADQGYGEISNDLDSSEPIRIKVRNDIAVTGSTGGGGVSPIVFAAYTASTATELDSKVDGSLFNSYTASTVTGLATKVDKAVFNPYTASTANDISDRLLISDFTGYTSTALTGGTNGLTRTGQNIELGGAITSPRYLNSAEVFDAITFSNLNDFGVGNEIYSYFVFGGSGTRLTYDNNLYQQLQQIVVNNSVSLFSEDKTTGEGVNLELNVGDGITINDSRTDVEIIKGIKYGDDYSSQYGARTLPDVNFVTGITSTLTTAVNNNSNSISTINNLYVTGGTSGIRKLSKKRLALGGALTGTTTFTGASATVNWGTTTNRLSSFNINISGDWQIFRSSSNYVATSSGNFLVTANASKQFQIDTIGGNGMTLLDSAASTNTVLNLLQTTRSTSGTAAAGIGNGISLGTQTTVPGTNAFGTVSHRLTNPTSNNVSSKWRFTGFDRAATAIASVTVLDLGVSGTSLNTRGLLIGSTADPQASSILELTSTGRTLTLSRIAAEANITTPINGMLYYDSTNNKFRARQNGSWVDMISTGGVSTSLFNSYTGTTAPATFQSKSSIATLTGTTLPATYQGIINQKTVTASTYTVTNADNNYVIYFTNTCTVTLPASINTATQFTTVRAGSGVITHVGIGGAVLNTLGSALTIDSANGAATWLKRDSTNYFGFGALGTADAISNAKFNGYTGTTAPATFQSKTSIATLTGTTLPATYQTKSSIATYTGTTVPNTYVTKTVFNAYTGSTGADIDLLYTENDDFVWGTTNLGASGGGWAETASGTGAQIDTTAAGVDTTENCDGVIEINCGTTSTGRCSFSKGTGSILFGRNQEYRLKMRYAVGSLSDGTDSYTTYAGFCDNPNAGDMVDGAYFRYTHSVNSGRWEAVTSSNSTRTATNTSVTVVANTFSVFEIRVNAAASSVTFYIDGVLVATNITNIPSGSGRQTGILMKTEKSLGTNARTSYVDYYELYKLRTTAR